MRRTLLPAMALAGLLGCATLDQALDDTSTGVAPPHPAYGTPVYVVPEEEEAPAAKQVAPPPGEGDVLTPAKGTSAVPCDAGASSTVTVIRLKHAKAEQLADTLSRILPPGTTVVPDPPTNSLIISAPSPSPETIAPE